jgi:hypothetical protein
VVPFSRKRTTISQEKMRQISTCTIFAMGSIFYALVSWLCINAGNILELLTSFTVFSFFIVCIRDFCSSSKVKSMKKESLWKNLKLILQLDLGFLALIFALFLFFITWNNIFFYFYIFLIMSLLVTGILIKKTCLISSFHGFYSFLSTYLLC